MRWHKEGNVDDGVLRHPSDSITWKSFDARHPTFSAELRNVRLGLASDGFQPYGNMSSNHSIWPVILAKYNLPPWDCMKNPYFMMTLLIPGPKCPGNDIDVYLQPMIVELKELWDGVETYDAQSKSNFLMRVAIMWTINDFPAYGNLSGWSTKGKLACPCCHKDTQSTSLRSKLCYMGHRRFLPMDHPWRRSRTLFDGKVEMGVAPNPLTGDEALVQLQALGNVSFGKGQKRKRDVHSNAYNWKKIMNMVGKTKDTLKSRYDLMDLGIRQRLHPIEDGNNILLPAACYALSAEEKLKVCSFLANLKVPDAFSSNISRCVNVQEKKIHGLKCHDHHVLLQDIFPVAIRGLLPKEVCDPIIALGKFFKNIYSKCLTIEDLDILEAEIPVILTKLQLVFPPAFFDVMVHLPIHLPSEAKLGGPAQYRNMYPIEREYTSEIESQSSMRAHKNGFLDWFCARIFVLSAQGRANDEIISLAVGPAPLVHRYSTFVVNGFRFHIKELEFRRKTQNSGVLSKQVFYLDDMVDNDWLVVVKTNPRDLFKMPDNDDDCVDIEDEELLNEEVYQQEEAEFNTLCTNDQENIVEEMRGIGRGKHGRGGTSRGRENFQGRGNFGATS
ncbi:PREDICTED: uncharacterized protein LOC109205295 [Nicotiana attenuata]|uniref:uncharacterized protein LOC109205295 n=1 Tax=Nicotiana attenuata TaxID=49451 RepID=UPI000904DE58|nr:PREDICTED: uncharacterized protein LOC109205295 [Nicotiana attenuata]